ncbi:hypothetical protein, partial [Pseudomonas aeruginosa]|uniref:hypothetical protein n=1 Tax=Pseudomonas aeruginosa TaxID=287 RepID=UPI001E53C8D8
KEKPPVGGFFVVAGKRLLAFVETVVDRFACFGSACKVLNCKGFIGYLPLFGLNIYPWCGRFVDTIRSHLLHSFTIPFTV